MDEPTYPIQSKMKEFLNYSKSQSFSYFLQYLKAYNDVMVDSVYELITLKTHRLKVLLALRFTRLGKRELDYVLFVLCLFSAYWFVSLSSSLSVREWLRLVIVELPELFFFTFLN